MESIEIFLMLGGSIVLMFPMFFMCRCILTLKTWKALNFSVAVWVHSFRAFYVFHVPLYSHIENMESIEIFLMLGGSIVFYVFHVPLYSHIENMESIEFF